MTIRARGVASAAALAIVFGTAGAGRAQPSAGDLRRDLAALEASRPAAVPEGTLRSIGYVIDVSERIDGRFTAQSAAWRRRAASFIERARAGVDPYPEQRGLIVNRSYAQELSQKAQGYAIYLPPDYDPSHAWPLMVVLHGGSSNGNLFLGVVLGNNMSWERYSEFLWDDFAPRWSPNVIVVAPDGFGQVLWRWMGEADVLAVIEDVSRHYNVDQDRVILAGLSNGGLGAYAIGTRHAWRFSVVQAIAGAPSWLQYAGGSPLPEERTALTMFSGMHLIEDSLATDFRFYHGTGDTGPMRPPFVRELEAHMRGIGLTPNVTWYDAGHDILYRVHRHGRTFDSLAATPRDRSPERVLCVTSDYRAARQHWVTVTRFERYPAMARVEATASYGAVNVTAENVRELALDLRDAPLGDGDRARIVVNGIVAYDGPREPLGHRVHLAHGPEGFRNGFVSEALGELAKRAGLSGPLTDAYYERMVHVYGTRDPEHTEALRSAAERGANGWPVWLWNFEQEVVADTAVTPELARAAHLVLYGTAADNAVLARISGSLPIRVEGDALLVGHRRFEGRDVGARFIHPNPENGERYVIVQTGVTPDAVRAGNNLPDFLPDYVVYDRSVTSSRPRLTSGRARPLALGYFDTRWRLTEEATAASDEPARPREGGQEEGPDPAEVPLIAVPPAPPVPPPPARFAAPWSDPAGRAARLLARRVATWTNFRAEIPGATWDVRERSVWKVRPIASCHDALREAGIPFRPLPDHPTPAPAPVEILGPIEGIWFRIQHDDRPLTVSCELARRLPALARILARHHIDGVDVMSAYRDWPRQSFHTFGLALDLARFHHDERGWLSVNDDFAETPANETCAAPDPGRPKARVLLRIACELHRSGLLASVLTPNYNDGHRDHFHVDMRPDDPRLFLR